MNYLLQRKNKVFIILIFFFISLILIILIFQTNQLKKIKINDIPTLRSVNYDISLPKFTINNHKRKISISAKGGNFINNDEIMLKENVKFKSKKFMILSNNVLFNKKKQTAKSATNSVFISDKTKIESEGFHLGENGDIIKFNGKTELLISK